MNTNTHEDILTYLNKVNPEFASYLENRFEQDRTDFIYSAMKACPSQDSRYWAKKSCNKCYGRGIIGLSNPQYICKCVDKKYIKWLQSFRKEYNDKRGILNGKTQ